MFPWNEENNPSHGPNTPPLALSHLTQTLLRVVHLAREHLLLLLDGNVVVQLVARVVDEEGADQCDDAEGDAGVEHHPESLRVGVLDRLGNGCHYCRGDAVHASQHLRSSRDAGLGLNDNRDEIGDSLSGVATGDGGACDVAAEVVIDDIVQDRVENGIAKRTTGGAESTNETRGNTELLLRDLETSSDIGNGGDPGETSLTEKLEDHPGCLVVGDDRGVESREEGLNKHGHDELAANPLDILKEGGDNPAANDQADSVWNRNDANLDRILGIHVESSLREQSSH